jgi:hypothetical protein
MLINYLVTKIKYFIFIVLRYKTKYLHFLLKLVTRVHRMTKHDYYSYIKIKQLYLTYKCFASE